MIRPNMATMLGFLATDACVDHPVMVQQLARELADRSFNRVTIDGDTSTNDSFMVIATNQAAHAGNLARRGTARPSRCHVDGAKLAQAIVRDGEGATKFITVQVGAARLAMPPGGVCHRAHSPLVKAFLPATRTGAHPGLWVCAGIEDWTRPGIDLHLDDVHVVAQGGNPGYRETRRRPARDEVKARSPCACQVVATPATRCGPATSATIT